MFIKIIVRFLFFFSLLCTATVGYSQSSSYNESHKELINKGQFDKLLLLTKNEFEKSLTGNQYNFEKALNLAWSYYYKNEFQIAFAIVNKLENYGNGFEANYQDFYFSTALLMTKLYEATGNITEANRYYERLNSQKHTLKEPKLLDYFFLHYGNFQHELGNYSAAENLLLKSWYHFRDDHNFYTLFSLVSLIDLYIDMGLSPNGKKFSEIAANITAEGFPVKDTTIFSMILRRQRFILNSSHQADSNVDTDIIENFVGSNSWPMQFSRILLKNELKIALDTENDENIRILIEYSEKLFAKDNPFLAYVYLIKASHENKTGKYRESINSLETVDHIIKKHYTLEFPLYQKALQINALNEWSIGNIEKAAFNFERSLYLNKIQYLKQFIFLSESEKELFYQNNKESEMIFTQFVAENYHLKPSLLGKLFEQQIMFKGLLFNAQKDFSENSLKNSGSRSLYSRYISIKEQLITIEKADDYLDHDLGTVYDSLSAEVSLLEKRLSVSNTINEGIDLSKLTIGWEDIKYRLQKQELLIDIIRVPYFNKESGKFDLNDYSYYCLAVFRGASRPQFLKLPAKNIDNRAVNYYKNAIKFQLKDTISYSLIWESIENEFNMDSFDKIYFVADGSYNLVNIASIYNPDRQQFVFEYLNIDILGNPVDLIETKLDYNKIKKNAMLFGYPDFQESPIPDITVLNELPSNQKGSQTRAFSGKISDLPGTREEIRGINEMIDGNNIESEVLMGNQASEPNFKNRLQKGGVYSPSIIHIATHGFFVDSKGKGDPLAHSGLLFSGAQFAFSVPVIEKQMDGINNGTLIDDGVLHSREAMYLNLFTTEIVVLSACETGQGVNADGEGVYGLHRAFQTAGAKTVIMSLWKVDDEATKYFMTMFYEEFFRSGDKSESMRYAREKTRVKYTHPYYWGAFVKVGI